MEVLFSKSFKTKRGIIGRKAQDATNAATLIGLIAALIILYITFLPADARNDLFGEDITSNGGGSSSSGSSGGNKLNATLLHENPGRIDFVTEDEYVHTIPSFYLTKSTNAITLKTEGTFTVRNGVFDRKNHKVGFKITDTENTKNIQLSFSATKRIGALVIKLNGAEIFNSKINDFNIPPIELDNGVMGQDNELEFSVSSVGWQFWRTNEYIITGLKIISDITDITRQHANNVFSVSSIEKHNLQSAKLKFIPDCTSGGRLTVQINQVEVFSGVPECNVLNVIELPVASLDAGENTIVFRTESGSYMIDKISINTKLKESPTIVYFFDITSEQKSAIDAGNLTANLSLLFVDDNKINNAGLLVNGHATSVYQTNADYSRVLPSYWMRAGRNDLRIDPKGELLIVNLKLDLYQDD